jgi:hypothetical protein
MNNMTGIWIDHKEAVLVSMENGAMSVCRIESDAEPRTHSSGGFRSGGTSVAQSIAKEQTADERWKHGLHAFYQEVIHKLTGKADGVYVFGPGEAKHELIKEMEKIKGLHVRIYAVETCDKMTEPQIAAKVKAFLKQQKAA